MYEKILDTFQWLPFAAVIQNKVRSQVPIVSVFVEILMNLLVSQVLVVHGGLFQYDDVKLSELDELDSHGIRGVDIPRRNHLTERYHFPPSEWLSFLGTYCSSI